MAGILSGAFSFLGRKQYAKLKLLPFPFEDLSYSHVFAQSNASKSEKGTSKGKE
jgi:hypothetical protein